MSSPKDDFDLEFIDLDAVDNESASDEQEAKDEYKEDKQELIAEMNDPDAGQAKETDEERAQETKPEMTEDFEIINLDETDAIDDTESVNGATAEEIRNVPGNEAESDEVDMPNESEESEHAAKLHEKLAGGMQSLKMCIVNTKNHLIEQIASKTGGHATEETATTEPTHKQEEQETSDAESKPNDAALERKNKREQETKRAQKMLAIGGGVLAAIIVISLVGNGIAKNIEKKKNAMAAQENQVVLDEEKELSAAEQVNGAYEIEKAKEELEQKQNVPTKKQVLEDNAQQYIDNMSLEEKVAGLFFVNIETLSNQSVVTSVDGMISTTLESLPIGGVIFHEKNMENPQQFTSLVSMTRGSAKYEVFTAISDEGGQDSPFLEKGFETEPIADVEEIVETGGVAEAYSTGIAYGGRLRSYGLNVNFGPPADVVLKRNSVIESRSFGTKQEDVLSMAQNLMKGMNDRKIKAVVRYFPSYGDVLTDGMNGKIESTRTKEAFDSLEGAMYKSLIRNGAEIIQTSVVAMPKITEDDTPACLSSKIVTDILRDELEYDGVILTDTLSKKALTSRYSEEEIAVQAIQAGCDMLLQPADFPKQYQAVLDAVNNGTITEERIDESLRRIFRVKYSKQIEVEEE